MSSTQKSWTLLAALSLFLMSMGFWIGERQGLLAGFILSLLLNAYAYFYAEYRWLLNHDNCEVMGQDPWSLNEMAAELASYFRIAKPRIFILPLATPTAFALGRNRLRPFVFITQGLMDRFNTEELRAVLALEMARIQRLDTLAFSVASALGDFFLLPALALDWVVQLGRGENPKHPSAPHLFRTLALPIAALPVLLVVGRKAYFDVDRRAAQALRNPEILAQVLWKLDSYTRTRPFTHPLYFLSAHLHTVNPLTSQKAGPYFLRHPPVERRIVQLIGRYPI